MIWRGAWKFYRSDPLEKLKEVVDFEVFRAEIGEGLGFSDGSKGGRPSYDSILIFKILAQLLDKENTCGDVWGDTAYRSQENETLLQNNGFTSKLHRKKPKGKPMPLRVLQANGKKSKVRSKVEHAFAVQKDKMGLFIRTIGLKRAHIKIGLANLVYNMKRLVFWERRLGFTG